MKTGVLIACVVVTGLCCAPEVQAPSAVARQPVSLMPPLEGGSAGARVGTSLAVCGATEALWSGAPGTPGIWNPTDGLWPSPSGGPGAFGAVVSCDAPDVVWTGGTGGSRTWVMTTWGLATGNNVVAFANELTSGASLVAEANGLVTIYPQGMPIPLTVGSSLSSVAWSSKTIFVGDAVTGTLSAIGWTGTQVTGVTTVTRIPDAGFGRSLAVGDFTSKSPGPEVAVGAFGKVGVFAFDGGLLYSIEQLSPGLSFGASLAVEPGAVTDPVQNVTLDALWVGQPDLDRVWRLIGDEPGTAIAGPSSGSTTEQFGAAIAVDTQAPYRVYVGAPRHTGTFIEEGAVYGVAGLPLFQGVVQSCGALGGTCGTCQRCVGGVVCMALGAAQCAALDGGLFFDDGGVSDDAGFSGDAGAASDAGFSADAGAARDAGFSVDAGAATDAGFARDAGAGRDAGTVNDADAGSTSDAGVELSNVAFITGCSSSFAAPALLLALFLARTARRR